LNSPDLTAEKFISDSFSMTEGSRLYRTGDLVRYRAGGDLEYVGRADDQVKIRGFRVELGEIQKQLERLHGVKTAVVLASERSSSDKYLTAYVERDQKTTGDNTHLSNEAWADGLRRSLRAFLPDYMAPASIVVLDEMPLNPNGKVDKKVLMALPDGGKSYEHAPPKTNTEIRVVNFWASLLGVDRNQVGLNTSLFDLGGHSLLLVRLANDIRVELGVDLPVRTLFDVIDLRDLAERIDTEIALQFIGEKMSGSTIVGEGYL
jgi:acyl carrier protein